MPLPLGRRVKPRADDSDDGYDYDDMLEGSSPSVLETGDADEDGILSGSDEDDDDNDDGGGVGPDVQGQLSSISFGTLARAQDSLSKKRKRGSDQTPHQEDKLEALRARLRELKEAKALSSGRSKKSEVSSAKSSRKPQDSEDESVDGDDDDDDDDNQSEDSEEQGPSKSRSSKHAPASQSSKRQVTRKRNVVDAPVRRVRDPRFGPVGGPNDDTALSKNYAFLNDYQTSEMSELRAAIKKTRNDDEKETLKRKLLSMESKKKARESKERQQEVLREHRKKEKQAIKEGKNPFYLKKSDQKQMALVEKFNKMKGKDREKLMERRRKKVAGKEKKNMPQARRMVG
ncbi:hypothetical protein MBLNU459_g1704t1 [Dothideomycetes sp. NU459]